MVRGQGAGGNGVVVRDCFDPSDLFSLVMQSQLIDMFVGATKTVVTTINFMCTAPQPMKLMLFTLANLSPMKITYLCRGDITNFGQQKTLIFLLCPASSCMLRSIDVKSFMRFGVWMMASLLIHYLSTSSSRCSSTTSLPLRRPARVLRHSQGARCYRQGGGQQSGFMAPPSTMVCDLNGSMHCRFTTENLRSFIRADEHN
jgi:hypothetical protein